MVRLIVMFLVLIGMPVWGQDNYHFEQLSLEDGLSDPTVQAILRDDKGMLWIGTPEGLNRYDGDLMTSFHNDPNEPHDLPDNNIFFLARDRKQNVWVGTGNGLARYNSHIKGFDRIDLRYGQQGRDYSAFLEAGNNLYFGSSDHLVVFNLESQQFEVVQFQGDVSEISLQYTISNWNKGHVLIASRWDGMFKCEISTGEVQRINWVDDVRIMDLVIDDKGSVWLSSYGNGLMKFDQNGRLQEHYTVENSNLTNNIILDICIIDDNIWMGTDGGGVNILNPGKKEIHSLRSITYEPLSSQLNSILKIYQDEYSNIWLGTIKGGVFGMRKTAIFSFSEAPFKSGFGITNPSIISLHEDGNGRIWIGTDGGGINAFYPDLNSFEHYASTKSLKVNGISSLPGNRLLINCFGSYPRLFSINSGTVEPFEPFKAGDFELPGTGRLGVGMHRFGKKVFVFQDSVYIYNIDKNRIKRIEHHCLQPGEGELRFAGSNNDNNIVLYGNRGVYRFDVVEEKLELLFTREVLSENLIYSACLDLDGLLWIGGNKRIFQVTQSGRVLRKIGSDFYGKVTSMISDLKNRIWFGTSGVLFSYNKELDLTKAYGQSDGVKPNKFLPKPVLRTENGDIYFGGVAGFVRIRTEMIENKMEASSVTGVQELRVDGSMLDKKAFHLLENQDEVRLPYGFRSLDVRLFVNDESLFNKQYVRYWLEGSGQDTVETSSMNLSFSNLDPGEYSLHVSAKTSDGAWEEPGQILKIIVNPPWWNTWWFYLASAVLLSALLVVSRYLLYRRAMDKMQIKMVRQESQMNEQRIKFLVNISHELRTPLSLIYGPLERMIKDGRNVESEQGGWLRTIFRQVNYIKGMIDQLLDFSRMEKYDDKLEMSIKRFNNWLQTTVTEFEHVFRNVGISFHFELDNRITEATFDYGKLKRVVHNFLMNVLRHAPETKTVQIKSELLPENRIRVIIADEGPGIPENYIERIFDRFYMGGDKKGTGIGLAFAKLLIQIHQGEIGARNREPKGAELFFDLPSGVIQPQTTDYLEETEDASQEAKDLSPDPEEIETLNHLTLLLVEDDRELLSFLKKALGENFKKILTAGNGREAMEIIVSESPDLVVSDVMMPVMDGWELCKLLKSDTRISHIPIILLTARSNEADSLLGYKLGADHYLTKPVSLDLLTSVVYNLMKSRAELKKRYRESRNALEVSDVTFSNADEEFLNKLNAIIEKEIENPELNVDFLVDRMAMSRASLYTKVKAVIGTGVNNYINDYKISIAGRMLKETDLSIADISFKLGFSSQGYFSTLFKQQKGFSPKKYQQMNR
ncbi:hybrid sensor histidine kinase/response regulator transcription factor [Marinilabilia sp.]